MTAARRTRQPAAAPVLKQRLLTIEEVAEAGRVSKMTVYRAVREGFLDGVRVGRRKIRIREDSARRWLGGEE